MLNHSSHHLRGAVLTLNVFPRYAKDAYLGLMSNHASGVHPGGVYGD